MSSADAVANCIFSEINKCYAEEGFEATPEGLNAASLTVPDSFATKTGMFVCQKGDLPFIKNCQFPLIGKMLSSCFFVKLKTSFDTELHYTT